MNNERFERIKAEHPDWSDEQIWTAVAIQLQTSATIDNGDKDIDPNDPTFWEEIISKAKDWLKEVWPVIFEKVKEVFANLLIKIREWIDNNLPVIIERIWEIIGTWFAKNKFVK